MFIILSIIKLVREDLYNNYITCKFFVRNDPVVAIFQFYKNIPLPSGCTEEQ